MCFRIENFMKLAITNKKNFLISFKIKIRLMQLISISKMAKEKNRLISQYSQESICKIISWSKPESDKAKTSRVFVSKDHSAGYVLCVTLVCTKKGPSGLFYQKVLMDSPVGVKRHSWSLQRPPTTAGAISKKTNIGTRLSYILFCLPS